MRLSKREKTDHCLNCGEFQGDANFCPNCGQVNNSRKPNVWELIREAVENLFAFDSRFYNTLGPLLFKPGRLTINYVEGKRARYVLPIRLFIISTFLLLAIVSCNKSIDKSHWYEVDRPEPEAQTIGPIPSFVKLGVDTSDMPQHRVDSLIAENIIYFDTTANKFQVNPEGSYGDSVNLFFGDTRMSDFYAHAFKNKQQPVDDALDELGFPPTFFNHLLYSMAIKISLMTGEEFLSYLSRNVIIILLMFIPIMAFLMKGLYFYKNIYYVDHFVFAIHVQTATFLYMCILIVSYWAIQHNVLYLIYGIGILAYILLAMKRFYKQNWFLTVLKFLILNFIMFIVSIIFILLVATVSVILY